KLLSASENSGPRPRLRCPPCVRPATTVRALCAGRLSRRLARSIRNAKSKSPASAKSQAFLARHLEFVMSHSCRWLLLAVCVLLFGATASPAGDVKPAVDGYGDPVPAGAVARLGTVRLRHGGIVHAVVF